MTATVTKFEFHSRGLNPGSRRIALRRCRATTIYGDVAEVRAVRLWRRISSAPAAMSGEACVIWSISGVAALGFVVLVFGGGML
jgi:hypothetical protein